MFKVNEYVMYGANGICCITDVTTMRFGPLQPEKYYVLCPEFDRNSKIYVPVANQKLTSQMRHVLNKAEIDELIVSSTESDVEWIEDGKQRDIEYRNILSEGDRTKIFGVFKKLYLLKERMLEEKRKFYERDARLLNSAAKAITEEFSFVLGISSDDVVRYITDKINERELAC